jgi:uncharacterized protein
MQYTWRSYVAYIGGLLMVAFGVSVSIRSGLGVSPISSIPYTVALLTGVDMGMVTIVYFALLIGVQKLILGDGFKNTALLQLPVALIFGYFTSLCNSLAVYIPVSDDIMFRLALMGCSIAIIAAGIFISLPTGLPPLTGEATIQAISVKYKAPFPKVKVCFDCTMVAISAITCIICLGTLGSVGLGTVLAAVFVGVMIRVFIRAATAMRMHRDPGHDPRSQR